MKKYPSDAFLKTTLSPGMIGAILRGGLLISQTAPSAVVKRQVRGPVWRPLAIVVIGGLASSTLLTLLILPLLYRRFGTARKSAA